MSTLGAEIVSGVALQFVLFFYFLEVSRMFVCLKKSWLRYGSGQRLMCAPYLTYITKGRYDGMGV